MLFLAKLCTAVLISPGKREMEAVLVSSVNSCKYLIEHHGAALQKLLGKNKDIVQQIVNDFNSADIFKKEKKMLRYAEKLTVNNKKIKQEDITKLKKYGLIDEDILKLHQVVAYFN